MARTAFNSNPGEIDLTDGCDRAGPVDDAILRHIVESAAYSYDDPEIRAVSSPRLELDSVRAAAQELLRRADVASRSARAARSEEELRLP